ncbi:unnamed protein product [Ceratitis capitata]|uniref:(Mediterranean fruit fly) hypothetical protein n=1 Tax=Ceratitis capitata TaxID=7213 RepID=A0A811VFY7_CERCA|nr:unnamed protein product [Ceratitis capitata]
MELAEIIQNYKTDDVVPFRGPPRYNPKRRSAVGWPNGSCAISCAGSLMGTLSRNSTCGHHGPPSPCPSEHIPYSSASSSLSEGSSGNRSHEDDISIVTDKSIGDTSDIISDSSGVGTNSDSAACSIGHPSTTVVCMEPYSGNTTGHISLKTGDIIEVVGSTDCGLLEGYIRGSNQSGFFSADCVQEYEKNRNVNGQTLWRKRRWNSDLTISRAIQQRYGSSNKENGFNEPRTIVLHRAKRGFGFILRGAKASSPLMQLKPTERFPALQYLDDVDPSGVADMAGLRPGDFLLAIGNEDVRAASHEKVVEMIRSAGTLVSMTVISPQFPNQMHAATQILPNNRHLSSGPSTPQAQHRQCATLPRKMSLSPNAAVGSTSGGGSGINRMPAPIPPRRDPKTTLSVGRARAKSMVAGLENGGEKDDGDIPHIKSSSIESIATPTPTHPGTRCNYALLVLKPDPHLAV